MRGADLRSAPPAVRRRCRCRDHTTIAARGGGLRLGFEDHEQAANIRGSVRARAGGLPQIDGGGVPGRAGQATSSASQRGGINLYQE